MQRDFSQVMANHPDAVLLEIVTKDRGDYEPAALAAAEAELEQRNLTPAQVESAEEELAVTAEEKATRANEPLGDGWKVLLVLFPGVLALLIAAALKSDGYHRKYKEVWRWTLCGFAAYVTLGVLGRLLR